MNTQSFSLTQLGQISITVRDVDRATAFYRDTLGVKHLFTVPKMSFFDCGGIRLMLSIPEGGEQGNSILYFRVADIQNAHQMLASRGVHFERTPFLVAPMQSHDLWMAFFRDSENNLLALMAELPKKS